MQYRKLRQNHKRHRKVVTVIAVEKPKRQLVEEEAEVAYF